MSATNWNPGPHGANQRLLEYLRSGGIGAVCSPCFIWSQRFIYSDFAAAATSKSITVNTTFANNAFPTGVLRGRAVIDLVTHLSGGSVTSAALDVGDAGTADEVFDGLNVFTGAGAGYKFDLDEAASAPQPEAAWSPTVLLACSHNTNTLTAGEFILHVPYWRIPDVPPRS